MERSHFPANGFPHDDSTIHQSGSPLLIKLQEKEDGEKVWIKTDKVAYYDEIRKLGGEIFLAVDITDVKRAEDALKQSEERFRSIVESNVIGIFFSDSKGLITDANGAFIRMLGYTRETFNLAHLTWTEVVPDEYRNKLQMMFQKFSEENVFESLEVKFLCQTGKAIDVLLGGACLKGAEGSFVCFALDITERKQMEFALRESQDRYQLVVEGSNDGIWDWDIQKNETYWNDRFFRMLGFKTAEPGLTYKAFYKLVHPEDRQKVQEAMKNHLENNTKYEVEFRLKHSSGKYLYCYSRGKALRNKDGVPLRMAGAVTDITERKMMEMQLQASKNEAEIANRRKDQFLANMSHEFRTPLNAIIGFSEMMKFGMVGELSEKQKKYIHNISVSGHHLLNIVNDLLDIAKIEAGNISLFPQWVNLSNFIKEVEETLHEFAKTKSIKVHYELQPGLKGLETDPVRLLQIIYNLMSNAIKFNHEDGEVDFKIFKSEDEEFVVFQVSDTGIGIPQNRLSNLFTQFYQIDNTQALQYEGTGLGLALTKNLVELLQGEITVESAENSGSTFTVTLPIHLKQ